MTGKVLILGIEEIEQIKTKLKVYQKIYLQDDTGQLFAYDTQKDTLALIQLGDTKEINLYFRKSSKK